MKIFNRKDSMKNDPYQGIEMTDKVKDTFSGFTGIVIARSEHLTGCNQVFVLPESPTNNDLKEGHWFDIERIELVQKSVVECTSRPTG